MGDDGSVFTIGRANSATFVEEDTFLNIVYKSQTDGER